MRGLKTISADTIHHTYDRKALIERRMVRLQAQIDGVRKASVLLLLASILVNERAGSLGRSSRSLQLARLARLAEIESSAQLAQWAQSRLGK
jgi:hypothetical protein